MRLEQVVLYGPGDDDRIRFGPRVTVFSGLGRDDRRDVTATIVGALTGELTTASTVYVDGANRRIFADRTGATYADSGATAPGPWELLGKDPDGVAQLLTIDAGDLGLGPRPSATELEAELTAARAELEALHARHLNVLERSRQLTEWRRELAELDGRIATSDDDLARWNWMEHRRQLDEARAELAMLERGDDGSSDTQLLAAVEALRTAGETWADVAAEVSQLTDEMGAVPEVSPEGLARVAATPDDLPAGFAGRLNAWRAAADADRAAQAVRAEASGPPARPADPLVADFAGLDQVRLWAAYERLVSATEAYAAASTATQQADEADSDAEQAVEIAHLDVVRAQRHLERSFKPAVAAIAGLALGSLVFGNSVSWLVAPVLLAAAAAVCWYFIVSPRRQLDEAERAEEAALAHTDAGSWLGLHLRRLDAVTDAVERKRFEVAANRQVAALVDWEEVAGARSVDDLTARADEVKAYAKMVDAKAVARRREEARAHAEATAAAERSARKALAVGLESYGITAEEALAMAPDALLDLLNRHIEAGRLARKAQKLRVLRGREREAANRLNGLLVRLGFEGDGLEARLERAIQAVGAARARQDGGARGRDHHEIAAEIARLTEIVESGARSSWAVTPEPARPPVDPDLLEARRREVSELIGAAGRPDVVGAERQYQLGLAKVRDLEQALDGLADQASVADRFGSRLIRNAKVGPENEPVPAILDDPFRDLPVADHLTMLDHLVTVSQHLQIVLLSADPLVTRWAKDRAANGSVVLFEAETAPETTIERPALAAH